MACHLTGAKPLPEPMMVSLLTDYASLGPNELISWFYELVCSYCLSFNIVVQMKCHYSAHAYILPLFQYLPGDIWHCSVWKEPYQYTIDHCPSIFLQGHQIPVYIIGSLQYWTSVHQSSLTKWHLGELTSILTIWFANKRDDSSWCSYWSTLDHQMMTWCRQTRGGVPRPKWVCIMRNCFKERDVFFYC